MQVDIRFSKVLSRIDSPDHFDILKGHLQIVSVLHDSVLTHLTLSCRMEKLKPTLRECVSTLIPPELLASFLRRTEHGSFHQAVPKYWNWN